MTLTNSFIAELVRDANMLDHLGIPPGPGRDRLLEIQTVALSIELGWRSDEEVRNALLLAAAMIRDLHIVLDSKTDISIVEPAS